MYFGLGGSRLLLLKRRRIPQPSKPRPLAKSGNTTGKGVVATKSAVVVTQVPGTSTSASPFHSGK